jgi:hypothetical protein
MAEPNHTLVMLMILFFKLELSKIHNQWDYALDCIFIMRENTRDGRIAEARSALDDAYFEFGLVDDTLTALREILKN